MYKKKTFLLIISIGYIWIGFSYFTEGQTELVVCPFRLLTDIPCPGCGLTRGIVALLHGEITKSITYHILSILITIAMLGFSFTLCYDYITKSFLTEHLFKIVNKCFSYWYISVPCSLIIICIWIFKILGNSIL